MASNRPSMQARPGHHKTLNTYNSPFCPVNKLIATGLRRSQDQTTEISKVFSSEESFPRLLTFVYRTLKIGLLTLAQLNKTVKRHLAGVGSL